MNTEAINHDPAITYSDRHPVAGPAEPRSVAQLRPGHENENLPAFVVHDAILDGRKDAQALFNRLWGSGFLPSKHQGVAFRSRATRCCTCPIRRASSPQPRRRMLDALSQLNQQKFERVGDPEIQTRIAQYEMAFRMQTSRARPDRSRERAGSTCSNCTARTSASPARSPPIACSRDAWSSGACASCRCSIAAGTSTATCRDLPNQCRDVDQPCYALITDLKQRGLLDDTLVVWGGEFGRTVYCQGELTRDNYGRDHHPRCFTLWMAGGGIQAGRRPRRNRRFRLQHRGRPGPYPRPERHDAALPGHRPPAADLQVPGPGHAAHGRRRPCGGCRRAGLTPAHWVGWIA